jgi:hypothetical protein
MAPRSPRTDVSAAAARCGYRASATSSLAGAEPAMMTSSPFFQFTGVATLSFIFLSGPITKTLRSI